MNRIKDIILDLDGPLLDGKLRHYRCYSDILLKYGFEPQPLENYWELKRARKSRKEILLLSKALHIYNLFLAEWLDRVECLDYLQFDCVQKAALKQLRTWRGCGRRIFLVTMRSNRENLMEQLKSKGLLSYFDRVVVCKHAEGGAGKASRLLKEVPSIEPQFSIWIGDTEVDFDASRYLKCSSCLVINGLRNREYLTTLGPEFLKDDISQVNINEIENKQHEFVQNH